MALRSQLAAAFRWSSLLSFSLTVVVGAPQALRGAVAQATATPTPTPVSSCIGDCNNDGSVTVDEILTMVNIALGIADVSSCDFGDANGDQQITIDEILDAVNDAVDACPIPVPTATPPEPTATPMVHTVSVGPNGMLVFDPPTLNIHVGDTVQWTWASSGHSVNSGSDCVGDDQFCSPNDSNCDRAPVSNKDATYSHTFTAPGTYPYFCTPHCAFGMVGTIMVE